MKKNKKDLDIDFIGGQETLTSKELQLISAFIKTQKNKKKAVISKAINQKRRTISAI
jgi:hypothetical protein